MNNIKQQIIEVLFSNLSDRAIKLLSKDNLVEFVSNTPINVANIDEELKKVNLTKDQITFNSDKILYLFNGSYVRRNDLSTKVKTFIDNNNKDNVFEYDSETDLININKVKSKANKDNKNDVVDEIKEYELIKAKLKSSDIIANKKLFSILNKDLKANIATMYVINKFYMPLGGRTFEELKDDITHTKDYVVSRIISMDENSKQYKNLNLSKFISAKDLSSLQKEQEKYFASLRSFTPVVDDKDGVKHIYRHNFINANGEKDYYDLVQLTKEEALDYESDIMGHCVGDGAYDNRINTGKTEIYSLRDKNNGSHATIEIDSKSREINQIQGKGNKDIVLKYHEAVHDSMKNINANLTDDYYKKIPIIRFKEKENTLAGMLNNKKFLNKLKENIHNCEFKGIDKNNIERIVCNNQISKLIITKNCLVFINLINYYKPLIDYLNFLANCIGDEEAKALAKNSTITNLDLSGTKIGDEGIKALAKNSTIINLDLSYNKIGDEKAKALAKNSTITKLYLSSNKIGDEGAKALAQNSTINNLDLSNNNIGDEGTKALAKNSTITKLYLSRNKIGDKGTKALAKNSTITKLYLSNNNIGDEGAKNLETMAKNNKNLIKLSFLNQTEITKELIANNNKEAENILDKIISGEKIEKEEIECRKNAIIYIAECNYRNDKDKLKEVKKAIEESLKKRPNCVISANNKTAIKNNI